MSDYKGVINLVLEGATAEQTKQMDEIIMIMFRSGVFELRNGKAILSFDMDGLQEIEFDFKRWKRNKPLVKIPSNVL